MKQHINLLARDVLLREPEISLKPLIPPAAVLSLVVLLAVGYALESRQSKMLEEKLRGLEADKQRLLEESNTLNASLGSLEGAGIQTLPLSQLQLKAVNDRIQSRVEWSEILRQISLLVPDKIYLTRLETVEIGSGRPGEAAKSGARSVRLVGFSTADSPVTTLIGALERSAFFDDVSLVYLQKTPEAAAPRVGFELVARLRQQGAI